MEKLVDLIAGKWPEMIIIFIVGLVVWIVAKFYFRRFVPVEDKINNVPCNKHNDYYKNMGVMAKSIRKIEEYIIKRDVFAIDELLRRCSPFRLTSFGEVLLASSGGKKCIDENIVFFDSEIQKLAPRVALDVENYALSVLNMNLSHPYFDEIKNFIFTVPNPYLIVDKEGNNFEFKNVAINHILLIMSVYLRDMYLNRHLEFTNINSDRL